MESGECLGFNQHTISYPLLLWTHYRNVTMYMLKRTQSNCEATELNIANIACMIESLTLHCTCTKCTIYRYND